MRQRLLGNNPYATAEIAEKLGEAQQRGYWEATPEEQTAILICRSRFGLKRNS